jgi:hypothetical protein
MESQTVLLEAGVRDVEPDGDASVVSREDLLALLHNDPDVIVARAPAVGRHPRRKGLATEIALILGTPGAFAALVRIFRLWLQRDKDRYIRITKRALEDTLEVVIDAKDISERAIEAALRRVIDHH